MENNHPQKESSTSRYSREASVYYLENYRQLREQSLSQREAAEQLNVPRSTLQGMTDYEKRGGRWKSGVHYWESSEGLKMLMGIVLAVHVVFNQTGAAGIRMLIEFFELSGLSTFIANSYGSQQAYANQISSHIATFGKEENKRLGLKMLMKKVTAVLDETFHPMPCLVAIEPVSNFILTETYSERRRAEDWKTAMTAGMEDLSVEVIQVTLEQAALQCVGFFQRSSSCVEGRNGVLRLRHHQLHRMSQQQLEVLTVLHNYWIQRPDGTNAAERFFEHKPRDLFEYLLEKMPAPSRPAQKRKTA